MLHLKQYTYREHYIHEEQIICRKQEEKMAVYLSEFIYEEARKYLEENIDVVDNFDHPEEIEAIILRVLPVDAKRMDECRNLKIIAKHGAGCDTIDLAAAKERGIIVTNTPTANSQSVAELIVGTMLDASRNITAAHNQARDGRFTKVAPKEMTGIELYGKTLGLIGTGNIARRAAEMLTGGFHMNVMAYDPYVSAEKMQELGYRKCETVLEVIEQSDFINVSVPLTPETKNLIAGDMFNHFKKDAVLVNAARGGIVNEDDLYEALKAGKLRAAACDAFVQEPPSEKTTKLYELPNFVGTPHIGATTEEALQRMAYDAVDEVLTVLKGGNPKHRVV